MLPPSWYGKGLKPTDRTGQARREPFAKRATARLPQNQDGCGVFQKAWDGCRFPEFVMKEGGQHRIVGRRVLTDVGFFGQESNVVRFRPEIDMDAWTGTVQGFQERYGQQEITQCSLMHHHHPPRQGRRKADY